MPDIRPAAVAGAFYPGDRTTLIHDLGALLAAAPAVSGTPPKALIVPHAGYVYSGLTAACAYRWVEKLADTVTRVVLLGPAHRVAVRGIALPGVTAFETPLGIVPMDSEAVAAIRDLPQVIVSREAHRLEHSLEVQVPFLQQTLGEFTLVPLVVGAARPEEVAEVIEALWGGPETLILISSDLSHFHPYAAAQEIDRGTVRRILGLHVGIDHEQACGGTPINGLLAVAARRGMQPELLDLRNSGDTAGDRGRVVGYCSVAFREAAHVH
ncbi:MAG: AmmeMemoRadiSam system protein B [Gammaproteobacteria bacterium]|nr:AmmeMemoRadiSam system protein B [Gammaproteobacteria bacterium]MBI5616724.1 AmmeMemoRadiSam system protein B [Gammaproteobacteria bacterium]